MYIIPHNRPTECMLIIAFVTGGKEMSKYCIFMLFNARTHRRNGPSAASGRVYENEHHNLQEYTYKKITPCDVCSQVLRGMFYPDIFFFNLAYFN